MRNLEFVSRCPTRDTGTNSKFQILNCVGGAQRRSPIAADEIADGAECTAEIAAAHFLAAAVLRAEHAVGETREGQRLNPDAARAGQHREEDPFPAENRRLDPADELDVVVDRRIECDETAGVDLQLLAGFQLQRHDRPAAVDEDFTGPLEPLEDEAFAPEEAGAEPLGELDVDVDLP